MITTIGIIIKSLGIGGAERQAVLLAKALRENYKVHLFVQETAKSPETNLQRIIETEKIEYIKLDGSFLYRIKKLNSIIKKEKIDLVFSYLTKDNTLLAATKLLNNRKLISVGGIRSSYMPQPKLLFNRFLHNTILDYVLFNNYAGRDYFVSKGFNKKKSVVIHNFLKVKDDEVSEKRDNNNKKINILSVGRFNPVKDYLTAIKAISYLQNELGNNNVHYKIAGFGKQEEEIRNWVNIYKLKNTEIVLSPNNLGQLYTDADIYLSTSLFEGCSNTIMEALYYGLPIVATDVGDNNYLVEEGYNGYLLKTGEHIKIAERINSLISDPIQREKYANNSIVHINEKFSFEKTTEKYSNLILEINNK